MKNVIEVISLDDLEENRLKTLLNTIEDGFKIIELNPCNDCVAKFLTICWPKGRISTVLSSFAYVKEWSYINLLEDALSDNKIFWQTLFKQLKKQYKHSLKKIPYSIFGEGLSYGFEHDPFIDKFAPRLDDNYFKSYIVPNRAHSLEKFLYWLDASWSELGDYFAWPIKKVSDLGSKEANYYETLFLKKPSTKWDNSVGAPIVQEKATDIAKEIEKILIEEVTKLETNDDIFILPCLEQIGGNLCNFPLWVLPQHKDVFSTINVKPVILAKGEAAHVWAEICALRTRLINRSDSPLFFETAKSSLGYLEEIVDVDHIIDVDKLSFNPIEELRCYVNKMQHKYPVLNYSLVSSIYTDF